MSHQNMGNIVIERIFR